MESKQCYKCRAHKPLPSFNKDCSRVDGFSNMCKDCNRARLNEWYKTHRDVMPRWKRNHPDRIRAANRRYAKKKRSTLRGKLNSLMGSNISTSLRRSKNGQCWEKLVGYTLEELIRHLSKQFTEGITWDNYGAYWHIDHKIPIAAFNFTTPKDYDFKACWSLKNLRPLEKTANLVKGDSLEVPFQPSLTI
jgi:hypothetical protein